MPIRTARPRDGGWWGAFLAPLVPLVASLAALLAVAAAPAFAARAGAAGAAGADAVRLRLEAPRTFVMYNADQGAEAENNGFVLPVSVVPGNTEPARDIEVVVDASGLAGVARVTNGGGNDCTGAGWVWTCEYGTLRDDGESMPPFTVHGVDGVRPGDSGTVTYTARADNAAPVTGTTRMVVGGPTLYSPDEQGKVSGLEPGRSASLTPEFANPSRFSTGQGVALRITARGGLVLTARPRNCRYDPEFTSAWCTFPTRAAPGTAYRTTSPVTFTAAPGELTGTLEYSWSSDPRSPIEPTVRGTGAPLTLTRTSGPGRRHSAGALTEVRTTVQADYAAVTGTVRGRVGDTVSVKLGVRDLGPGRPGGARGTFEVVPPEGTTVTSVPYTFEDTDGKWACRRPGRPGGAFVCDLDSDVFRPGDHGTTTVDFRFRIDRQVPGARGTVRTHGPYDRTPGNDTAGIPLEASPALPHRSAVRPALLVPAALVTVAAVTAAVLYRRRRRAVS
ncbi:hypothetical protein ACF061_13300 [Streptomyces sp. NPDC015220]|uniref:hypothetical protein n=1 Tax=Streptomyces sp. NPDC015220 TaxID=3364947 RepID=UPI0036FAB497